MRDPAQAQPLRLQRKGHKSRKQRTEASSKETACKEVVDGCLRLCPAIQYKWPVPA
jgi:hypothetical protein